MNSKNKGDISESVIISKFLKRGIPVSIPFGDNQSYDLIIDVKNIFKSVQVKTGRYREGVVIFDVCNSINTKNLKKENRKSESYKDKVDYLAIYCPELDEAYLINPKILGETKGSLRVLPPKKKQSIKINWAKDYLLEYSLIG